MDNIVPFDSYKKCGTVTVSVYRTQKSKQSFFYVKSDNESVLPVSYIIEDTLKLY